MKLPEFSLEQSAIASLVLSGVALLAAILLGWFGRPGNRTGPRAAIKWRMYLASGALLVASIAGGTAGGITLYRTTHHVALMPRQRIVNKAIAASSPVEQQIGWNELIRRLRDDSLPDHEIHRLVEHVLEFQKDPSREWSPDAGQFLEQARSEKKVSDEQMTRYARQGANFELVVRPKVRKGDPLPAGLSLRKCRLARHTRLSFRYENRTLSGDLIEPPPPGSWGTAYSIGTTFAYVPLQCTLNAEQLARAELGKKTLKLKMDVEALEGARTEARRYFKAQQTLEATWELVDKSASTLHRVPDNSPELRAKMEEVVGPTQVRESVDEEGARRIAVKVPLKTPPVQWSHYLIIAGNGKELDRHPLPTTFRLGGQLYLQVKAKDFDGKSIDIFFEPDPDIAHQTADVMEFWDGYLAFRNIPISEPQAVGSASRRPPG